MSKHNIINKSSRGSQYAAAAAICKSAPRSRQITTPVPHHSVFYRPDALLAVQPHTHTHTHTRLTALCPGLPGVSRYQKGKTNLDFTEATDSKWQWHQLGYTQVCTSLQTDNHATTPPLSFLQAGCPSCCPTKSVNIQSTKYKSVWYSIFTESY